MELKKITPTIKLNLPSYSLSEELLNAITHGIGSLLSILGTIILIKKYWTNPVSLVFMMIYCFTLFLLYTISTLYHALKRNRAKAVFRKFDHCSIFLLIAGTYTPICAVLINNTFSHCILAAVWILAIIGIVFNAIDVNKFSKFSLTCYILMGWSIIFIARPTIEALSTPQLTYLLIGGIFYTVGAIIYVIGKKIKYMHSVWHLFVLAGSILQFLVFIK